MHMDMNAAHVSWHESHAMNASKRNEAQQVPATWVHKAGDNQSGGNATSIMQALSCNAY